MVRPEIREMESRLPGDSLSIASKRLGLEPEDIIKLDANENPYGCSVRVQELLAGYDFYHHFPDPLQSNLRVKLESYTGIRRERIVPTNGVRELTDLIMRVFVRSGDEVIICPPTVPFFKFYANLAGAQVVEVPRHSQTWDLQIDQILEAITPSTKLILIGSPNNPTGNLTSPVELTKLLNNRAIVVVDESFYEFAGATAAGLVAEFDNLIVMRSFSYWAGLAGLRLGYGLIPQEIAKHLWKIHATYDINVAQQLAAEATLEDPRHYEATLSWIRNERGRLYRQLRKLNFLQPYPSKANFLLCQVVRGNAFAIKKRLERQGIFIKSLNHPELPEHLRISVGRPEDTDVLMRSLFAMAEEI